MIIIEKGNYECCKKTFKEKALMQHQNDVHGKFNCLRCLTALEDFNSLLLHEEDEHSIFTCRICLNTFSIQTDLNQHLLDKEDNKYHYIKSKEKALCSLCNNPKVTRCRFCKKGYCHTCHKLSVMTIEFDDENKNDVCIQCKDKQEVDIDMCEICNDYVSYDGCATCTVDMCFYCSEDNLQLDTCVWCLEDGTPVNRLPTRAELEERRINNILYDPFDPDRVTPLIEVINFPELLTCPVCKMEYDRKKVIETIIFGEYYEEIKKLPELTRKAGRPFIRFPKVTSHLACLCNEIAWKVLTSKTLYIENYEIVIEQMIPLQGIKEKLLVAKLDEKQLSLGSLDILLSEDDHINISPDDIQSKGVNNSLSKMIEEEMIRIAKISNIEFITDNDGNVIGNKIPEPGSPFSKALQIMIQSDNIYPIEERQKFIIEQLKEIIE